MNAFLISIKPKWCAKIMNGDKTIEVRKGTALYKAIKKQIDQYGYAEFYVYCTKDNFKGIKNNEELNYRGKVIFKFRCYKVEEIRPCDTELLKQSCLSKDELINYLCVPKVIILKTGYAIHISDLEIFDRPRELCEFHTNVKKEPPEELLCPECGKPMEYYEYKYLTKAPQSWCYIEVE